MTHPPDRLGPLPVPEHPLHRTNAQKQRLQELAEQVRRGLDQALAQQEAVREQLASAPQQARGEALDGAVTVEVDDKGLIRRVDYGPDVADLTPEELGEVTLRALGDARAALGRGTLPPDHVARLNARPVAAAIIEMLRGARER